MYKLSLVFLFLCFIHGSLKAQAEMELHPKILEKEINRLNGDANVLSELTATSGVTSQLVPGRFYTISTPQAASPVKYAYVGRVKTCRSGGCSVVTEYHDKESEYFDYFILYDSVCSIRLVKIYNYQATHGQEVTAKSWLKQFIGYHGETELVAGKNVDAISGATISVHAINYDIEYRTELLKQVKKQ